jgi:hypothetical protein
MQLTTYSNFDRFIPVVRSVKPQALLSAIIDLLIDNYQGIMGNN